MIKVVSTKAGQVHEPCVVDPSPAARILEAVSGTPMELPAAVALATGMRRGEILALRWGDLDPSYTVGPGQAVPSGCLGHW